MSRGLVSGDFLCQSGYGIGLLSGLCELCPPGTYSGSSDNECYSVPAGYYNPLFGQSSYSLPCEYATVAGAMLCVKDGPSCNPGQYYNYSVGECVNVPIGAYNPNWESAMYYYCPHSIATGAANCAIGSLNCTAGEYDNGSGCEYAPVGYHVPYESSAIIYSCEYSVRQGAANCNPDNVICAPYNTFNATFAKRNYGVCSIVACPGATVTCSGCGAGNGDASNDQYLQVLYDGAFVAQNDDYCGFRSQVSFTVNSSWTECGVFELHEGCYQNDHCIGRIAVTGAANCPVGTVFTGSGCEIVPAGYYNPDSPGGTYYLCPHALLPGAGNCQANSTEIPGAPVCSSGYFYNSTSKQCALVPAGYYNPYVGSNGYYYCGSPHRCQSGASTCHTPSPTMRPTDVPSVLPTFRPTQYPTLPPTLAPTLSPTTFPTPKPSGRPTRLPTDRPTTGQPVSAAPSVPPSQPAPTARPTCVPSRMPTMFSTQSPTTRITSVPTCLPTTSPTGIPTLVPITSPTSEPTVPVPTASPATAVPTLLPTSAAPTAEPTGPSEQPTTEPSLWPNTRIPCSNPTQPTTAVPSAQPTAAPSFVPTVLPSATPTMVTAAIVTAIIKNVSISKAMGGFEGSAALTVALSPAPSIGGTVYCAAFYQNVTVSGVSAVQTASYGTSAAYAANVVSTLSLSIYSGLATFADYYAYCVAVNANGDSIGISAVRSNRAAFFIGCCKSASFISVPPTLYADASVYQQLDTTANYFMLELSSLPSTNLSVSCLLMFSNGTSVPTRKLAVIPSSYTLTSTSKTQAVIFYLNGSSHFAAQVVVRPSFGGASASEYDDSTNATIDVISQYTVIDPPILVSAVYSSTGSFVTVTFDHNTDNANITQTVWNCTRLLIFRGDSEAICSWISARQLIITFETTSVANAYAGISVRPGLLGSTCPTVLSCVVSPEKSAGDEIVYMTVPEDLAAPAVVLNLPSQSSVCDDLVIDATGSTGNGGRDWLAINWTVTATCAPSMEHGIGSAMKKSERNIQKKLDDLDSISSLVNIPNTTLVPGVRYCFTLSLTTFLKATGETTACVTTTDDVNMPRVSIPAGTNISVPVYEALSIQSSVLLSSCADAVKLFYSWTVSLAETGENMADMTSTSLDPTLFLLPANSLTPGNTYLMTLTVLSVPYIVSYVSNDDLDTNATTSASVTATVHVTAGSAVAVVVGGLNRQAPISLPLVLDASLSYDENYLTSVLAFEWTCLNIALDAKFGTDCAALFFGSNITVTTSAATIAANSMSLTGKYAVTVRVATTVTIGSRQQTDAASATVFVSPAPAGAPAIAIISPVSGSSISLSSKLTASATITTSNSSSSTTCIWSALSIGSVVNLTTALTPVEKTFAQSSSLVVNQYSLVYPVASLVDGRSYIFSLTCCTKSTVCTSNQININMASPPTSGSVTVSPASGMSLVDIFTIASSGWKANNPDCYPFQYSFFSRASSTSPAQMLRASSSLTYVTAYLPCGIHSMDYKVYIYGYVGDALGGTANATTVVTVEPSSGINVPQVLQDSIAYFTRTMNVPALLQSMNSVSSIINTRDCSQAPNCTQLNRYGCSTTVNTCGSCFAGYFGVVGDSNVRCVDATVALTGQIGDVCASDDDCVYEYCENFACTAPMQLCPTASVGDVCSGNGECAYVDVSGNHLPNCTVVNTYCKATCLCYPTFGGDDCSLNSTQLAERDSVRSIMCSYAQTSFGFQDPSSEVIEAVGGTLGTAFSSFEVSSEEGLLSCLNTLDHLSTLSTDGYLAAVKAGTADNLLGLVSAYTLANWSFFTQNYSETSRSPLTPIIGKLVSGLHSTLVAGQSPITIAQPNVRVSVGYASNNDLINASLAAPASTAQAAYSVAQPSVTVSARVLSTCGGSSSGSDYTQTAVVAWGRNPHPNSTKLGSPVMQVGFTSPSSSPSISPTVSFDVPAYFVTIQFESTRFTNLSSATNIHSNRTLPECTYHTGHEYVSCAYCNISTYTDTNVTYACYDPSILCASLTAGTESSSLAHLRRRLADDDNALLTSNDGGLATYGMIATAIAAEIETVLTADFSNIRSAIGSVIFVCLLFFVLICGLIFFGVWDRRDHDKMVYLHQERLREARAKQEKNRQLLLSKQGKAKLQQQSRRERVESRRKFAESITNAFSLRGGGYSDKGTALGAWLPFVGQSTKSLKRNSSTSSNAGIGDNDGGNSVHFSNHDRDDWLAAQSNRADSFVAGAVGGSTRSGVDHDDVVLLDTDESDVNSIDDDFGLDPFPPGDSFSPVAGGVSGKYGPGATNLSALKAGNCTHDQLVVFDFFDSVIPPRTFLDRGRLLRRFKNSLMQFHPYISMLAAPSCVTTRMMRWLSVSRGILVTLFVDTLFFGIFYPANNNCPSHTTEASCLLPKSKVIYGSTLCRWNSDNSECHLNPPPADLTFVMTLALLTVLCVLPLDLGFGCIMDDIAAKRPRLEEWGINSNYWLGSTGMSLTDIDVNTRRLDDNKSSLEHDPLAHSHDHDEYDKKKFHHFLKRKTQRQHVGVERILNNSPLAEYVASILRQANGSQPQPQAAQPNTSQRLMDTSSTRPPIPAFHHHHHHHHGHGHRHKHMKNEAKQPLQASDVLNDITPAMVYYDYCAPEEELNYVLTKVKRFWQEEMINTHKYMNTLEITSENESAALNDARASAFLDILHVYPNGAPMPLSFTQWLMYGNAHNKVKYLIERSRRKADEIVTELRGMEKLNMHHSVDVFLVQHFIMEQVGTLTRFALSKQFFNYSNEFAPFPIATSLWLAAWILIIGVFAFYFYWILAWGVTNGGQTLRQWSINFGISIAQDFFFVQPLKILVLYILSVEAARPQLRAIHRRMIHMATALQQTYSGGVQGTNPLNANVVGAQIHSQRSRSSFSTLIQSSHDFNVVHHTSPACRAARMSSIGAYPAAFLLRQITDLDIQCFRESKRWGYGTLIFFFVAVPALIGLISDLAVDGAMETVLPSVFAGFLMFNYALYHVSPVLVVVPYVLFVAFLVYFFCLLLPSVAHAQRLKRKRLMRLSQQYSPTRDSYESRWFSGISSRRSTTASHHRLHSRVSHKRSDLNNNGTRRWLNAFKDRMSACIIAVSKLWLRDYIDRRTQTNAAVVKATETTNIRANVAQKPKELPERVVISRWQHMNIPQDFQGHVPSATADIGHEHEESARGVADDDHSVNTFGTGGTGHTHTSCSSSSSASSSASTTVSVFQLALPEPIRLMIATDSVFPQYRQSYSPLLAMINRKVFNAKCPTSPNGDDLHDTDVPEMEAQARSEAESVLQAQRTRDAAVVQQLTRLMPGEQDEESKEEMPENSHSCVGASTATNTLFRGLHGNHMVINPSRPQNYFELQKLDYIVTPGAALQHIFMSACHREGVVIPAGRKFPQLSQLIEPKNPRESEIIFTFSAHGGSEEESVRLLIKFPEQLLCTLVKELWDIFLPGGFELSSIEKDVILSDFRSWCTHTHQRKLTRVRYISIFRFAEWFCVYVDDIIRTKTVLQSYQCECNSDDELDWYL